MLQNFSHNNLPLGNIFHAIVSVTAVNIQFNSPRGVRRSFNCPGILNIYVLKLKVLAIKVILLLNKIP